MQGFEHFNLELRGQLRSRTYEGSCLSLPASFNYLLDFIFILTVSCLQPVYLGWLTFAFS